MSRFLRRGLIAAVTLVLCVTGANAAAAANGWKDPEYVVVTGAEMLTVPSISGATCAPSGLLGVAANIKWPYLSEQAGYTIEGFASNNSEGLIGVLNRIQLLSGSSFTPGNATKPNEAVFGPGLLSAITGGNYYYGLRYVSSTGWTGPAVQFHFKAGLLGLGGSCVPMP